MTESSHSAFERLALPLQRCLWEQGWAGLRAAQIEALPLILDGRQDVVISSATASGKTEAAFLPLLTRLWQNGGRGIVLYVAPMKALINDQEGRLRMFCERMEIPVYPWHGDIGVTPRKRFMEDPNGIVLITPESLESLLFRRGGELKTVFSTLEAIVVDELHAFIGSERGRQLQSLLHRLEVMLGRRVQRIGLSATLGDLSLAADFLRIDGGQDVHLVVSEAEKKSLQLVLKAIIQPEAKSEIAQEAHAAIAAELFTRLRDANCLIFPISTGMVEFYADALRRHCEAAGLPVTFFPHHGRLAKSEREVVESSLKRGELPVSAICTTTLEVGIDIGAIRGIVQIGAPDTVASLCQRIGRAGRRAEESAMFWQYCVEEVAGAGSDCIDGLYSGLIQAIAVTQLFLLKWYEPPATGALHYSTLVQQILSLIGERHGITAADTYQILCKSGPFRGVSESDFIALLRAMVEKELVMQDANRLLLHGVLGEKLVNHYTFFAAFPDSQEYRLRHAGKELGTLPLKRNCFLGDALIFAGRRWRIAEIDHDKRRVELIVAPIGKLPRTTNVDFFVHDRIRQEMRRVLADDNPPPWLNEIAKELLHLAARQYRDLALDKNSLVIEGSSGYLFLWRGDRIQDALAALFKSVGLKAENQGICVKILSCTGLMIINALSKIGENPCPKPAEILSRKKMGSPEKWDWTLPDDLFYDNFASSQLELAGAHALCCELLLYLKQIHVY